MRILVAYASSQGSTQQIARQIAEVLERSGLRVEVLPAGQAADAAGYDAVVLGSAIHNQAWLPEAADYFGRNAPALAGLPVWMFSVGMPDALPGPMRRKARELQQQRIEAALAGPVRPREHRIFSGVYGAGRLPAPGRFLFRLIGGRLGDLRDWPQIRAWAEGIAGQLVPAG
ncbi:flavodoxin domain-containing protein, partial [Arthrobacter sp. GCM10027362]|uniref:flavodoxin domain-containing protein n=1 Tax=Arthrobacter sp. GCM10027362 TaxID=3273379 RepID=UPI0036310139